LSTRDADELTNFRIRAIRTIQGRGREFDAYYHSLFETYHRLSAFKDELRRAIEGTGVQTQTLIALELRRAADPAVARAAWR
jgi:hypothetical protein